MLRADASQQAGGENWDWGAIGTAIGSVLLALGAAFKYLKKGGNEDEDEESRPKVADTLAEQAMQSAMSMIAQHRAEIDRLQDRVTVLEKQNEEWRTTHAKVLDQLAACQVQLRRMGLSDDDFPALYR